MAKGNQRVYYNKPKTMLEYCINFFEDNKDKILKKELKNTDMQPLHEVIKEKLGEFYPNGELWTMMLYLKQWQK